MRTKERILKELFLSVFAWTFLSILAIIMPNASMALGSGGAGVGLGTVVPARMPGRLLSAFSFGGIAFLFGCLLDVLLRKDWFSDKPGLLILLGFSFGLIFGIAHGLVTMLLLRRRATRFAGRTQRNRSIDGANESED